MRTIKGLIDGKRKRKSASSASEAPDAVDPFQPDRMHPELKRNEQALRDAFKSCSDIVYRSFQFEGRTECLLVYVEGLADSDGLQKFVIAPLTQGSGEASGDIAASVKRSVAVSEIREMSTLQDCSNRLLDGEPILLVDGVASGLALGLTKWESRSIEEPVAESTIRGPRGGFTETLRINTAQLRRIIKSSRLKLEPLEIGEYTRTKVVVAYVEGLADTKLVDEVKARLSRIRIDGILESGYIEELIEDQPFSPFPQLISTERPDTVCSSLLEGRVAIMIDGTPFALVAPVTFVSFLQAADDYYQRFLISTIVRWLRYIFLALSLLLPSIYVAILTYHQEMVPGTLLLSMASSREIVPFPALVEALLMEATFEALREAGVRLPKQIGAAVSIVGGLVIGQAAVQAGIVTAPMVIVVALTGISSFMIPRYVAGISVRMLRFPMILLGGTLGLLGVMMGTIAIVLHMGSLRSFGVPYLSTLQTPIFDEMKDVLIRAPWWSMRRRPRFTGEYNALRQPPAQKPGPDKGGGAGN
ncbi:spore germination protein [Cohnella panacarvi]|uniref:spore germination protein n=1 Tax=Cohnella panacarvi TaxID=400776 RepID=UPI0004797969|nr:spore germination protein [Cohnella panacarvi]